MDIRQLRSFVTLAQRRQFTRAAAHLHTAQPALSQQIQQLEQELGVRLLQRTHRRVELTAPGEVLLARAERILAEMERAQTEMAEFAGLRRGRVLLGVLQSLSGYWLSGVLTRFYARYPGIEIESHEDGTEQLVGLLAGGRLDFAVVHVTGNSAPTALSHPEMRVEPLFRADLLLITAPGHALAQRQVVAMPDLRNEPFIAFKPGGGLRHALAAASAAAGFAPHVVCESGNLTTIRALVAEGMGVAVLPRSVAEAPGRAVAVIHVPMLELTRRVVLACRADHCRSAAAEACMAFLRMSWTTAQDDTVG